MRTSYKWGTFKPPREVAPGVFMQLPGTVTCEDVELCGAPYTITIGLDMTADGIRPVSVTVAVPEGSPPVTGTILRAVPVQALTRAGILTGALRGRPGTTDGGGTRIDILSTTLTDQETELIRLRGPVRESLEWAAYLYNMAQLVGLPPARQVETGLGLPHPTATKWIRRAKDMGLIGPEERNTDGKHHQTP